MAGKWIYRIKKKTMIIPASSYRIQLNQKFNFNKLAGILDYLNDLGITTIYASPILRATEGSDHGYDGIDPATINPALGSEDDLAMLAGRLREKGMSWIQDIVPNHLAFNTSNYWLRDVLERGINSSYAHYFDIDWEHPFYNGKLMTPFLEATLPECIAANKISLQLKDDGFVLRYYEELYPVSPETYPLILSGVVDEEDGNIHSAISALIYARDTELEKWQQMKDLLMNKILSVAQPDKLFARIELFNSDTELLSELLAGQHYVLCHHMRSHTEINYRRFFNVNGLICLRMEDAKVFDDYHALIHRLFEKGYIQGLRIDHIDGLKDPKAYIDRLRNLFGNDCYIIVEKILDQKEKLPTDFSIQGTSGYEFLSYTNQVLTDNQGAADLIEIYQNYVPENNDYEKMVYENKFDNLKTYLNGEWDNLLRLLLSLNLIEDEEIRMLQLKDALGAIMAGLPVYRLYISDFPLNEQDRSLILAAVNKAVEMHPQIVYEIETLEKLFHPSDEPVITNNRLEFLQRLMQFTGPLAAKGVEDTTFYHYNPLISHNEVGDEPCQLGISNEAFHEKMHERQNKNPLSFNCTSTHDTKRGEDARVRINLLSELTQEWKYNVAEWQRLNEPFRVSLDGIRAPVVNHEYFLYQAIIGGFPEDGLVTDLLVQRTQTYFVKALRESKQLSDHVNPNIAYEKAASDFIAHLLNPAHSFLPNFLPFLKTIISYANVYSLVQVIIKTAAPGIPDIYQGCELWDNSYVDPDNRRPVNYDQRRQLLNELQHQKLEGDEAVLLWARQRQTLGAEKLLVSFIMLQLRKKYPELFKLGEYVPLIPRTQSRKVLSFARHHDQQWLIVILPLGIVHPSTDAIEIDLPGTAPSHWKNVFTGEEFTGKKFNTTGILGRFPVAVFVSARN